MTQITNKNLISMRYTPLRQLFWVLLTILPIHTNAKVIAFGNWGRNGNNVTWVLDDDTLFFRGLLTVNTQMTQDLGRSMRRGYAVWK